MRRAVHRGAFLRPYLVALAFTLAAPPARLHAYSYASPLATGCHEEITFTALRALRAELDTAAPLPTARGDRAWIDDLPFDLPAGARDLGAASLIAGVRDNDVKAHRGIDAAELAQVHGDPDGQREHCLRRPEHDEPDGSARALGECRAYIRERVAEAVRTGFDVRGVPDPGARVRLDVHLAFAGEARVPAQRAYVELGRALHALQDSFSHAVRSEDGLRVRALLNWVDFVSGQHDALRDGPAHRAALDRCEHLDPVRQLRLERATESSIALLRAAFDPALDVEAKLRATDAVLDRYLSLELEPGCDASNEYCDAPELAHAESEHGCAVAPVGTLSDGSSRAYALAALCALAFIARRRARRRRAARIAAFALVLVLATPAVSAAAQTTSSPPELTAHDTPANAAAIMPAFALASAVSVALDEAGAAAALGARHRLSERFLIGLDAEWNPWASLDTGRVRPGTLNTYATLVFRSPLSGDLALRVTAHAGASLLLFDLYGAPRGSLGPYAGLSLLGLEIAFDATTRLILEPGDVSIAVPQVRGIPLIRRQYRATVALELWL